MRKKLVSATLGVIWLLLMLPAATAQALNIQQFAGTDNVNGFAKEDDELTITVIAEMPGQPIPEAARERVRVYYGETFEFMDECERTGQNYLCTYKTTELIQGGVDEYAIVLYDAEGNEVEAVERTLTVDFLSPRITAFSTSPDKMSEPKPVTITYAAEDYGSITGQTTDCAGIKTLQITADNKPIARISGDVGECVMAGTTTWTPEITGPTARVKVCATATDHLGHQSLPQCQDVLIDSKKPTAQALELRDTDGLTITHARTGQTIIADVFVSIPDIDVNPETITADFSKPSPALGQRSPDDQSNEWFIWRSIPITNPEACEVTIHATDFIGNEDTARLTCEISIDDTPPELVSIQTGFVDEDGTPLLGKQGTITAVFEEAGAGLRKANVFMDFRSIGAGAAVKAQSCEQDGTAWECSWAVKPRVPSRDYTIKLLPNTEDDTGNALRKTIEQKVRVDITPPQDLRVKEITAFRDQQKILTDTTSLGEFLEFVVEGKDFTTVTADFSALGGHEKAKPEKCSEEQPKTCTFGMTTEVSGPHAATVTFLFSDTAGNTAELTTRTIKVLGISDEPEPNYWDVTADCSPKVLDRATLSVFEHPVYCRLKLSSQNPRAKPITVQGPLDITDCKGQTDYVSELSVQNNYAGSKEPFLILKLVPTEYALNELELTCPVRTLTRIGDFRPQNFEQDDVEITLEFTNLPIGDAYTSMRSEVENVKERIDGVWETIGELQSFINTAKKLCNILNMITTFLTTMRILLKIINAEKQALKIFPPAEKAVEESTEKPTCFATEAVRSIYNWGVLGTLNNFCQYLTCQKTLFDFELGFVDDWVTGFGVAKWSGFQESLDAVIAKEGEAIQNPKNYLNVYDSLIYSIFVPPLCIPGIIHNLDKYRQIECRYGLCLLEDVREGGLPVSVCKDQKAYMHCRFWYGEIFNMIPFLPFLKHFLDLIHQALSDPLTLATVGIAFIFDCKAACTAQEPGIAYDLCAGAAIASQFGQTITWISQIKEQEEAFEPVDNVWCDDFEDKLDEFKAEEKRGTLTTLPKEEV